MIDVLVVGAGPSGSFLACLLARAGHSVRPVPKRDHLNVGVFSLRPPRSIRGGLSRFMSRYRLLENPSPAVTCKGFAIPVKNIRREYERGGVLLVADAGRVRGIAVRRGDLLRARDAVHASFDRPGQRAYSALVARRLEPELR